MANYRVLLGDETYIEREVKKFHIDDNVIIGLSTFDGLEKVVFIVPVGTVIFRIESE